jgi:hypothetical protein
MKEIVATAQGRGRLLGEGRSAAFQAALGGTWIVPNPIEFTNQINDRGG